MTTQFMFTVHPGDMIRGRLIEGVTVMLVASAFWDDTRKRFKVRRPPADHIASFVVDSGGFTAAKRWGRYPWTLKQYVQFLHDEARDIPLAWAATMDYACEREVNRETYRTNLDRITATIDNEVALRELAPDIPWMGVLQGNTLAERAEDIERRRQHELLWPVMGVGSVCGRKAKEAAAVLRFYGALLPDTRFHAFGLDIRTLDYGDDLYPLIASWDTYAWNWPRGPVSSRPSFLRRVTDETRTQFTLRTAEVYLRDAVSPRLRRPRQLSLEMTG